MLYFFLYPEYFTYSFRVKRWLAPISQEKLAELAGVHRNYIGLIERAELDPAISYIDKIAKALKIKISDLMER